MKILRIITRLNIGGPSLHVLLLSSRLNPQRFTTCLVAGEPASTEGDLSETVRGAGVRMIRLASLRRPIRPWADLVALVQLCRIVTEERPAIIHTHTAKAGTLGRAAGLFYNWCGHGRTPGARAILIHTFHGHVLEGYFSVWMSRFFVKMEQWLARRTDVLIAVSPSIRDQLIGKGIGRAEQWRVIPLGLELDALGQLPSANGAAQVRVGLVGRLAPIKNPSMLLEAFQQLMRQPSRPPLSAVLVGDGPLRRRVERDVERFGLQGIVQMAGWQADMLAVYRAVEIACLTSWNEGTPVSLIEAMAAGRAVVSTDVGGVRDLLGAAEQPPEAIPAGGFSVAERGILVRAGDVRGLAAALDTLAADPALRERLGRAARPYALGAFSSTRLVGDLEMLYTHLCPEV